MFLLNAPLLSILPDTPNDLQYKMFLLNLICKPCTCFFFNYLQYKMFLLNLEKFFKIF